MKRILTVLIPLLFLSACSFASHHHLSIRDVNNYDYSDAKSLDIALHSDAYLLVNMSSFKVEYAYNSDKKIYPASLTKLLALDAILANVDDVTAAFGYITADDSRELLEANASIAGLSVNEQYSFEELLYALILPSGGDATRALENGLRDYGYDDLVALMNKKGRKLGLVKTKVRNAIGLHDDQHYSCLEDILLIVEDILQYKVGKEILESLSYELHDGKTIYSTVNPVVTGIPYILGGKTGYTGQAGQNICVLYVNKGRSYLLLTAGAMGNPSKGEYFHYEDVLNIFDLLYN
ncbi:MAG: serine hydrolase [Erysipelotrichaceae bacterium]|nr:serine hydrolase [Erysipelotrichaceae bacterium]